MRLFLSAVAFLIVAAVGCADATPETACDNVATVCGGNTDLEKVQTACESAVTNADQTTLNCIDAANTCSEASACVTAGGS